MATETFHKESDGWYSFKDSRKIDLASAGTSGRVFGDPGVGNMYFGATNIDATNRESDIGQRVGCYRHYWNNGTGGAGWANSVTQILADVAVGRVPWASYKFNSPSYTWAQVAAGSADSWLVTMCNNIVAGTGGKGPVMLTFHHEPNGDGTASDYLAMERHLQTITDDYPSILHVGAVLSAGYYQMTTKPANKGGPYHAADWMQPDSCDVFGLDIYNSWAPSGGTFISVDQAYRLGGIAQCLAIDSSKPIAIGEWGVRTYTATPGRSATWMQDAYDYCRESGVMAMTYFDSGVNSPDGPWTLDLSYTGATESPAERLIKFNSISHLSTSKLIPAGGLSS